MPRKPHRGASSPGFLAGRGLTLALIALITVLGAHLLTRGAESLRLDLTEDDLYSLTDGTETILARMAEESVKPIEISLYFSETTGKTLPRFIKDFIGYERYLRALLREYARAADGRITLRFVDPLPDSDDAQDALDDGLDGKPINQQGDLFFFGLVFETQTGSRDVIEFLWPNEQETVEYEITRRLYRLLWPSRQRVGVLSSLEVVSDASNPYMAQILAAQGRDPQESWLAFQVLAESYDVSVIDPETDRIDPAAYDLVVVVHPKALSPRALWALDAWTQRGGSTLVFVDPYAIDDRPPQNPQQPWLALQYAPSSDLDPLLTAWGVERIDDAVALDFDLALSRATRPGLPASRVLYDLSLEPSTHSQTFAAGHPILQGLDAVRMFVAGGLQRVDGASDGNAEADADDGVRYLPLITTTPTGATVAVKP
ncbi:MAG: GldG family protein, partial [Acidobacteriota bacterium]